MGRLYLEAGIHIIAITSFVNLGVSLLARNLLVWTNVFPVIYLVQCFMFIILAFFHEKIWSVYTFVVIYVLSTIAEIVFFILSYLEMKDLMKTEDEDCEIRCLSTTWERKLIIFTICMVAGWALFRLFAFITVFKFY